MARRTVNRVELIGFVGQAPQRAQGQNGADDRVSINIATHREWKEGNETKQSTNWTRVVAFGKLGTEVVAKLARGGAYVRVIGRLDERKVEGENGPRFYSNVVADEFFILDKKPEDTDEPAGE